MKLKELIQNISKDIEILDSYTQKSFFGMNIDYVSFKIGNNYYLVSKSESPIYVLSEQTKESSKNISNAKIFEEKDLIEYIKKLLILEN